MNWAKGRATKGRGTSFKGALRYVLHDKQAATSERVGFVNLRNLATDNPHQAWREMVALCDAAGDLKQRSGVKATGQKLKRPVYAFTLNWHEDDRPDPEHMRATAESALQTLGMQDLQAVLVEHTDTAHRHVHVIVNLIDPDTGKARSVSNDGYKLDRWADRYEQDQGVIRSPDRRAKLEALDQGRKPPKRKRQASSREEWEATRALDAEASRKRVDAIRTAFDKRTATLKAEQAEAYRRRRAEGDRLWTRYRAEGKGTRDRYQPFIDAIFKSKRKGPPHPATEQALRDLQDTAEWKELGRRQWAARRHFNVRERHALGVIVNAIRLHRARQGEGGMAGFFMLAVSGARRRSVFDGLQQGEKRVLGDTQHHRRKVRADTLRAACRHELAQQAAEFKRQRKILSEKHAAEIAADKAGWRDLSAERAAAWADFEREHSQVEDRDLASRDGQARSAFNEVSRADGEAGKSDEGRTEGTQSQVMAPSSPNEEKRGWRARRKAADRQADGSYKTRDRDPGRTRRPTR